eukprot:GHVU01231567.1.p1 GENE.GHVU01231567.1~~GHVU01231567.1.p1  ORF type:complete len:386 (+),score=71.78 GHVU01231567.1:567-1724(+)
MGCASSAEEGGNSPHDGEFTLNNKTSLQDARPSGWSEDGSPQSRQALGGGAGGGGAAGAGGATLTTTASSGNLMEKVKQAGVLHSSRIREGPISDYYDISSIVLGTGISGAVRIATRRDNGLQFAVKTLSTEPGNSKRLAMVHNEVKIYLKLDHPNIAKLREVFEDSVGIHLVMELCTGKELYDSLASRKKYSENDAKNVTRQMLSAVNYCHKHSICHRDLKLENWVYADPREDAPLKLIDFGFSRLFNRGIPMTAMHGTVYYVSPEVMDGCYREKCDIWSIGVIVYMLLSGNPPFNGTQDHSILIKIRKARVSFEGPRWGGISDAAKDFVASLLVKDPERRPSAEEALQHPWLVEERGGTDIPIDVSVLQNMKLSVRHHHAVGR